MSVNVLIALAAVARAADCEESTNVAVSADRAVRALFVDGNPAAAVQEVAMANERLDCQVTLALPQDLARLYQAGGSAALELGDVAGAQRWFRQAALMAPKVPFDQATFGVEAARAAELAYLTSDDPTDLSIRARGALWVDGRSYGPGDRLVLTPSEHLVQYIDVHGAVQSSVMLPEDAGFHRPPAGAAHTQPPLRRAGGAALTGLGVASLVGWGFYYADESAEAVRRGDYKQFSQGPIIMWGIGGAGLTAAGALVLVF